MSEYADDPSTGQIMPLRGGAVGGPVVVDQHAQIGALIGVEQAAQRLHGQVPRVPGDHSDVDVRPVAAHRHEG